MQRRKFHLTATIYDKRGKVLSKGENSYMKTHPLQKSMAIEAGKPDAIFLHAEIAAIVKLKDWSKAHRIVIERYDKQGKPRPANPCKVCRGALKAVGINIIKHT